MGLPLMMSMTICNLAVSLSLLYVPNKIKPNEYVGVVGRNILHLLVCIHQ